MSKQALLDQIKADIITHDVCPHLAQSATQLVFGDGDPNAELLFIGEAPGRREDEQGTPFVGASGKLLNDMLASINLKREQVYITNIVKYRPPENRDPSSEEKQEFMPFLIRQIQVINPKLIVCLGRHSGMVFLPELKISHDHGQPKRISLLIGEREGTSNESRAAHNEGLLETRDSKLDIAVKYVVLPLYHPAAALYNGGQRQTLMDDFKLIPTILEKIRTNKET